MAYAYTLIFQYVFGSCYAKQGCITQTWPRFNGIVKLDNVMLAEYLMIQGTHDISRFGIDVIVPEYFSFSTRKFKYG